MKLILDHSEAKELQNIIDTINKSLKNKSLTELNIAIAYNSSQDNNIISFWDTIIESEIPTNFFFLYNSTCPIDKTILEKTKDIKHIYWYPILKNFHCKIIYAKNLGAYIGSANMSQSAWSKNFEAGVWLEEKELVNNELASYLEKLKEISYSQDKKTIYDIYCKYCEQAESSDRIENSNEDLFDKLLEENSIEQNKIEYKTEFEKDIDYIYQIFFTEIYPEVEKYKDKLPKDFQDYPLSYITDQILLVIREEKESSKTIEEVIDNIENLDCFTVEDLKTTMVGYQKNYNMLIPLKNDDKYSLKDKTYDFIENIHAVTSEHSKDIADLVRVLNKGSKMGKSFSDVIKYLVYNTTNTMVKRFYNTSHEIDWKIDYLAEGRIGEIIGMAQIDSGYKNYCYPVLNGGVRKSLKLLGYSISKEWRK